MNLSDLRNAQWHCEPPLWEFDDKLMLRTGSKTDFWRGTYYGFYRDNGHFLGLPVTGNFTAVLTFTGVYETLYDQAGLMLRVDDKHWMKTGIEFSDSVTNFSAVVTRENSDWSATQRPLVTGPQSVRVTRVGSAILIHFKDENGAWQFLRLANFPAPDEILIGPAACSPERAGFQAVFTTFKVGPVIENPLHS
ncbi:MAG: DUF1349 domain-containing protein [Hyphomicrobiales bacterium]